MSIPSRLIAGFIRLTSSGSMGARIVHSWWLIESIRTGAGPLPYDPTRPMPLFIAQGLYRIEVGGLARRIKAEEYPHRP